MSISSSQIRGKIIDLYPEITKYNLDIVTEFSEEKNSWVVTLVKDGETLFTHIDKDDAKKCIEGERCVHFGNQLMGFIDAYCTGSSACHT
ncbi:hypothetical protein [Maridesulfovibrio hydrothermalis]|uniref:Dissimilatory siroheme-sulfite reductase, gamma subunit-like protein n=1 Tax=Maridesulfovibrio hydrothermalis AM13 = DSM 14728 TaxID=1121451 RepID=L0RA42_9BACT|nr:hypothetical protein [Maridesulfovibrio hydrothermalis]CCO23087.1 conserved protein of unknown function [Maridesulfovibrio hydrothermalis AM13 = DSM 14728]